MDFNKRDLRWLICGLSWALVLCAGARAQDAEDEDDEKPRMSAEHLRKAVEVIDTAKRIGPWENQYQVFEEAANNIFDQQGWNSEPDQFARGVMQQVGRVPPWDPQKRQEVFVQQLQGRYGLTHDQMGVCDKEFQREGMRMAMKHFATVAPVMLEIVKTRAMSEPFTPDQVQRWTKQIRPMMDDAMDSLDRISGKLEQSMTPDQRRILQADIKAVRHRHDDMKRMAEKWAAGQWSPADWGLQNDPIHAGLVAESAARDAEKNALVEKANLSRKPDEKLISKDESQWDKYVKWFCNNYQCDERQRTAADGILRRSKKEAADYFNARRDRIEAARRQVQLASSPETKKTATADLDNVMSPVTQTFERMKQRLYGELLTTEQRLKYTPPEPAKKAEAPPSE